MPRATSTGDGWRRLSADAVERTAALDAPHPAVRLLIGSAAVVVTTVALIVDPERHAVQLGAALAGAAVLVGWAVRPVLSPPLLAAIIAPLAAVATLHGRLEVLFFLLSLVAVLVGLLEPNRWLAAAGFAVLVGACLVSILVADDDISPIWLAGMVVPFVTARADRHQQLAALELAAAKAALAEHRVDEERRRIARDVHDAVGHGLAAMLLHVAGARHHLRRDPDGADRSLADAEAVGRASLDELRRTLGLLRDADGGVAAAPLPTAADLTRLGVTIDGDLGRVDRWTTVALHRVAEEALANARAHAPGATTDASLRIGASSAELVVSSIGAVVARHHDDGRRRYGIVGMRERMAAVDGTLDAGPTATGWRVTARAPIPAGGVPAQEAASDGVVAAPGASGGEPP